MGKVLAQTTISDIWNLEISLLDHVIYRLFINRKLYECISEEYEIIQEGMLQADYI